MKKYISQNWQKIMKIICVILLVLITFFKFTAPKTIINDYIKYGKVVTPLDIHSEIIDEAKNNATNTWNSIDPQMARLIVVLMVGILFVVFLSMVASSAGAKKDSKKK